MPELEQSLIELPELMRMIPATRPASAPSNAERKVFDSLQATKLGPSVALHSLRLTNHAYKAMGEIDFLLVTPHAILVIEVKGGGVDVDASGIWHFTDRFGVAHASREGPFRQVASAMYALMKRRDGGNSFVLPRSVPIGFGIIFPDCEFRQTSVEWDLETVLSSQDLRDQGTDPFLKQLTRYWRKRTGVSGELSQESIARVVNLLRPTFDAPLSLGSRAADIEAEIIRFTDAQLAVMEAVSTQERVLCTGGAGTGKTMLALDVSRRLAEGGSRPAFVCKSPFLASAARIALRSEVDVLTIDQLSAYGGSFDALVIDEAQDFSDCSELFTVMDRLEGGMEGGRWYAFADPNNQADLYSVNGTEVRELLEVAAGNLNLHLTRNCRNSAQVVVNTQLLTGADVGEARAGNGVGVAIEFFDSPAAEAEAMSSYIESLLDADVLPRDIAILRCPGSPPLRDGLTPRLRRMMEEIHSEAAPITATGQSMTEASVIDFKGLESSFVAIGGFPADLPRNFTTLIYTALTRAKAGAWIGLPTATETEVTERLKTNLRALHPNKVARSSR